MMLATKLLPLYFFILDFQLKLEKNHISNISILATANPSIL